MDHADDDGFLIRVETRQIGLGPDGGEGLTIDRGAVPFVVMGHHRTFGS